MQLPDFLVFGPFNQLRKEMGAQSLGDFVFFNPAVHLCALERHDLANTGIGIEAKQIYILDDFSLAFKNSRVVVYVSRPQLPQEWVFHIASCEYIMAILRTGAGSGLRVATAQPKSEHGKFKVCHSCLHRLKYQGHSGTRNRHLQYSLAIEQRFQLSDFFQRYTMYPVEPPKAVL